MSRAPGNIKEVVHENGPGMPRGPPEIRIIIIFERSRTHNCKASTEQCPRHMKLMITIEFSLGALDFDKQNRGGVRSTLLCLLASSGIELMNPRFHAYMCFGSHSGKTFVLLMDVTLISPNGVLIKILLYY